MEDILVDRRNKGDFIWVLQDMDTQDSFSPKLLDKSLLECIKKNSAVMAELVQMSPAERQKAYSRIDSIFEEMNHGFSWGSIRHVGFTLAKIFKQLYDHIHVDAPGVDQIRRLPAHVPVLYLPTHRSYVDFLLVSFVCFHYQIPLPVIAAGMDFKSMLWVGELLRACGAFFIRRRLHGDRLYAAVLRAYVQCLALTCPQPAEFFIEGTRSRAGKPLPPRTGLLSSYLELLDSGQVPDMFVVPISISYDRVLEEGLYAYEMLGTPKPPESTGRLVRAVSVLAENYGSVHVRFGTIFSARQWTAAQALPLARTVLKSQTAGVHVGAGALLLAALQLSGGDGQLSALQLEAGFIGRQLQLADPALSVHEVTDAAVKRALHIHHQLVAVTAGSRARLRPVAAAAAAAAARPGLSPATLAAVLPRVQLQIYVNVLLPHVVSPALALIAQNAGVQDRLPVLLSLLSVEFPTAELVAPPALQDSPPGRRHWCDVMVRLIKPYLQAYLTVIEILLEGLPSARPPLQIQALAERRCMPAHPAAHLSLSVLVITHCLSALLRMQAGSKASGGAVAWEERRVQEVCRLLTRVCRPPAKL